MGFSSDINLYISSSNVVIILSLCLCLAVFSRGKFARKGRWRRTNIYPRRAILFDLQFESSSGECGRRVQVCVCVHEHQREREREREIGGRRIEEVPRLEGENAISGKCLSRIYEQIDFRFSDSSFRDRS